MNAKTTFTALFCALAALPAFGQGFAGLGFSGEGFARPDPATRFAFPQDHGAHPSFRIEWWYVTANLTGPDGADYGVQWTLFRNALAPNGDASDQIWMGHAAISTPAGQYFAERFARGGTGQADVNASPFEAFIDEWRMAGASPNDMTLTAQGTDFRYDLTLKADRPFVVQGANGHSVKSTQGLASHYYSQPFFQVTGQLNVGGQVVEVTGLAWMDREWSSQPLTKGQTGWDWISLHLKGGEKLMGYRLRDDEGGNFIVGTWIMPDGTPSPLQAGELTMTPIRQHKVAGRDIPVTWDITLPSRDLKIQIDALYPDSWMGTRIPYWEGPVTVTGSHQGKGYLELSGY